MDTQAMYLWPSCLQHGLKLTALTLLLALSTPALAAVSDTFPFELDANAQDVEGSAPPPATTDTDEGDDWDNTIHSFQKTGIVVDAANQTIFQGGGNKDINEISQWTWSNGSAPPKDELNHAFAAAYDESGDLLLYFGADRFANNGDAFMGFWFFKKEVDILEGGKFSGEHTSKTATTSGDLLILINFPQGTNKFPELAALEWDISCNKAANNNPSPGECAAANLRLKLKGTGTTEAGTSVCAGQSGDNLACALTNTGDIPVPAIGAVTPENQPAGSWNAYKASDSNAVAGIFPYESFFEGGLNVTKVLGSSAGCFSSFMAETRSSSSYTAALKDFVVDNFKLCGIQITKTCTSSEVNANQDGFTYGFTVEVKNTGHGALHDVVVTDAVSTAVPLTKSFATIPAANGTTEDGIETYTGTFTSSINGATNTVSVKAAATSGGEQTITATDDDTCAKVEEDIDMTVDKNCETILQLVDGKLVARVDYSVKVCNTSDKLNLLNVKAIDLPDGPDGGTDPDVLDFGTIVQTPSADSCETLTGSYYPTSAYAVSAANGTYSPEQVRFRDEVTVTADAPLGLDTQLTLKDEAICPLCECADMNNCPPTTP